MHYVRCCLDRIVVVAVEPVAPTSSPVSFAVGDVAPASSGDRGRVYRGTSAPTCRAHQVAGVSLQALEELTRRYAMKFLPISTVPHSRRPFVAPNARQVVPTRRPLS